MARSNSLTILSSAQDYIPQAEHLSKAVTDPAIVSMFFLCVVDFAEHAF